MSKAIEAAKSYIISHPNETISKMTKESGIRSVNFYFAEKQLIAAGVITKNSIPRDARGRKSISDIIPAFAPDKEQIRAYTLKHCGNKSHVDIAKDLGVKPTLVRAYIIRLRTEGKIPNGFLFSQKTKVAKVGKKEKKAKTALNVGEFKNFDGSGKNEARNFMISAISNSKPSKRAILSLPAEKCILEKRILKEVSANVLFEACELNRDVYFKMLQTIANENLPVVATYCSPISDLIYKARESEYAHVVLDYCGSLLNLHEEIAHAILHKIVEVGGTISITLTSRIGKRAVKGNFVDKVNEKLSPENTKNCQTLTALERLVEFVGYGSYVIERRFSYRDSAPMLLLIIRRVK